MPRQNTSTFIRGAVAATLLATLATGAVAEDYPTRPVHWILPVPAGGPTDTLARILGQKLSEIWKQSVVVDNRPGAQGIIGTEVASRASPDGYTLLMLVDSTVTMLPFRKEGVSYDPKSLMPVMTLTDSPMLLVASSVTKADTLADFVRMAKTKPGQLSIATGTFVPQVFAAQFATVAGIQLLPVPYKGAIESTQAVLAGDVNAAVTSYSTVQPNIGTGKFNILAITGTKRYPALPDVPTLSELGYPGFENGLWVGLAVPTGTPDSIIQKLHSDFSAVMEMPDVVARINGLGSYPFAGNPSGTAELIRTQSEKWKKIIPTLKFE